LGGFSFFGVVGPGRGGGGGGVGGGGPGGGAGGGNDAVLQLVYSNIIDLKLIVGPASRDICRDGSTIAAKEVSSHSQIDQKEKWLVEGLSVLGVALRAGVVKHLLQRDRVPYLSVQHKLNGLVGPDGAVRVEVFGEVRSNSSAVGLKSVVWPGATKVEGRGVLSILSTAVLHDVDLSRCWPASVNIVAGKHPQCGP